MYHARCLDLALSVECFWNYVQSEDEQCGSSVKCQRERLAHPRHPGASETRVLSQPPCLSTSLQRPWANSIFGRIPCNPSRLAYVIITFPLPGRVSTTVFTRCHARDFRPIYDAGYRCIQCIWTRRPKMFFCGFDCSLVGCSVLCHGEGHRAG